MSQMQIANTDYANPERTSFRPTMYFISISISSCSRSHVIMTPPTGKWVETSTLDIIRRAVLWQEISDTERQKMEEFLEIPPHTSVAPRIPASPRYVEAPGQEHANLLPLLPVQDPPSDSGSSIIRTSTHGTHQTGSSGFSSRGQPSSTGSPRASSSQSAHREQSPRIPTGSPGANPSASTRWRRQSTTPTHSPQASSSASTQRERFQVNPGIGQPDDWDPDLILPDPQLARDRSDGSQREGNKRRDR